MPWDRMSPVTWIYRCDTEIAYGRGLLGDVRTVMRARGGVPALLVRGKVSLERSGALAKIRRLMGPDLAGEIEVAPLPGVEEASAVAAAAGKAGARGLLAAGGGSAIDAAKAAALSLSNALSIEDLLSGKRDEAPRAVPLVALPSTAGTGAEATAWAELWDRKGVRLRLLEDRRLSPTVAIIDPDLIEGTPRETAAATGLGALAQNVEAYWSKRGGTISRAFAAAGARRAAMHAVAAANGQRIAREEMAAAALIGGLAVLGTRRTVLHALSIPLTLRWDVPRGFALALTLPALLRRFAGAYDRDTDLYASLNAKDAESAAREVERLMRALGAPTRLGDVGVRRPDLEGVAAAAADPGRAEVDPVALSPDVLREVLETSL